MPYRTAATGLSSWQPSCRSTKKLLIKIRSFMSGKKGRSGTQAAVWPGHDRRRAA